MDRDRDVEEIARPVVVRVPGGPPVEHGPAVVVTGGRERERARVLRRGETVASPRCGELTRQVGVVRLANELPALAAVSNEHQATSSARAG